jgi:YVTN family beta-propeller protein
MGIVFMRPGVATNMSAPARPARLEQPRGWSEHEADYGLPGETIIATIPVGDRVGAMVVSPAGERTYVAQSGAITVLESGHNVIASIPVKGEPRALAISDDGTRLIVLGYRGSVATIDTRDHTVKTIAEGWDSDVVVSPDGRYIYAANNANNGVEAAAEDPYSSVIAAIDVDGALIASAPVINDVRALAVSPDGSRLYAVSAEPSSYYQYPAGWLATIDTAGFEVIDTTQIGADPLAVIASPDGTRLYITHDTATVSAVDLAANTMTEIALDDVPLDVSFTPDGLHAYVTHPASVTAIDAVTHETDCIVIGEQPQGVQLTPDGKRAYVTNLGDGTVSVIDTITNSVTNTLALNGRPEAMAMSPDGDRLYVGDYWAGTVTVISAPSVQ